MTIFDSSVWIAFLLRDDSQHTEAVRVIHAIADTIGVPESVIDEVCTVLSVRFKRKDIADQFIDTLQRGGKVNVLYSDPAFFDGVLSRYQLIDNRALSFTDVILLCFAEDHSVVTFDADLRASIARVK
ncbi:MAG: type II toxin-antitoxin system VapC family toxin [Patescibacteria group bacterium]